MDTYQQLTVDRGVNISKVDNSRSKVDLVLFGDDTASARPEVFYKVAFPHEFRHEEYRLP